MNFYPELLQRFLLYVTSVCTGSNDVFLNSCALTNHLFTEYHEAFCLPETSREDIIRKAHFNLFEPDIAPPYPGVILVHGSSQAYSESMLDRKNLLLKEGFAVMIIDSFTHTRIYEYCQKPGNHCSKTPYFWHPFYIPADQCPATINMDKVNQETLQTFLDRVVEGMTLMPAERTHELFEAIQMMKSHAHIKPDQISIIGYSHGGSVVLEALSLAAKNMSPPGSTTLSGASLAGVNSAVAYYPNCRPGSYFENLRATPNIPTLLVLADRDEFVSPDICQEVADDINQRKSARFITTVRFDAQHAFDMKEYPGFNELYKSRVISETLYFIKQPPTPEPNE